MYQALDLTATDRLMISWIKLLRNYRSHKSILHYPNTTFYDGELEVCGNRAVTDAFLGSSLLVSPTFPVIFHALAGHNDREASSPSYFNIDEASEVKAYIDALLADRSHPIRKSCLPSHTVRAMKH